MKWKVRRYRLTREFALPRSRVWDLLSNTDHLNRIIGLYPIEFSPVQTDGGALFRTQSFKVYGFIPVHWKEFPFEWVKEERYTVLREYLSGPFKRFFGGVELADGPQLLADGSRSTLVSSFAEFTPAGPLGLIAARIEGLARIRRTLTYIEKMARRGVQSTPIPVLAAEGAASINTAELDRALADLGDRPVRAEYIPLLRSHLITESDDEVLGIRPYRLARQWQADPMEVLRLCLYATKAGALRLNWSLLCPNCRVSKATHHSLAEVNPEAYCDFCGGHFRANFDRYVELRFDVHRSIREAVDRSYCVSGPAITPHILRQEYIERGSTETITFPQTTDELRLRVLRLNHVLYFADGEDAAAGRLTLTDEGWDHAAVARPGAGAPLTIANRSAQDIVVALEQVNWEPDAVTAAQVTAMQEFRDLFSAEVLAPGLEVGVESVTLLFTDLAGSTAMYEQVGDANAYGKVRRHFDFMIGHIAANGGSLVKTIGDAVMAVFYTPAGAVRAALAIQAHVDAFNASLPEGRPPVIIKIGIHHGPAIAINANDKLDYFGRTVNIAARVQGESKGGDIVLTAECLGRPGVAAALAEYHAVAAPFGVHLKGIGTEIAVARIEVPEP